MEFDYIPNQKNNKKSTKDIMSNVKELPKNMIEKIKKTVEEMKKKGQKLTPNLKKLLTKALAGSLVAGMLFMAGCSSVQQAYSLGVANQLDNADYEEKLEDYNERVDRYYNDEELHEKNENCKLGYAFPYYSDLKMVPEQYYVDNFNIAEDKVWYYTTLQNFVCSDDKLYAICYSWDQGLLDDVKEYKEGRHVGGEYDGVPASDILKNHLITKTLFEFNIGKSMVNDICKYDHDYLDLDNSHQSYPMIMGENLIFELRYLLDEVFSNTEKYSMRVLAQNYCYPQYLEANHYGCFPEFDVVFLYENKELSAYCMGMMDGVTPGIYLLDMEYEWHLSEKDGIPIIDYEAFKKLDSMRGARGAELISTVLKEVSWCRARVRGKINGESIVNFLSQSMAYAEIVGEGVSYKDYYGKTTATTNKEQD